MKPILTGMAILLMTYPAYGGQTAPIDTGAFVSFLPPVYPSSDEQKPNSFGVREMMHCPDGYKLSFEAQTPCCIPMTSQELAGSLK